MNINDLVYIDSNGNYIYADYPTFLTWVQDGYKTIYGADVYLKADSQDGQWVAIQAKAYYDMAVLGASVYNSFSPTSAQGTGLSRLVKINGISRRAATYSTADLTIVGTTGTTINNGVAIDTLSQKWDLPAIVTIPSGGTITVTATAETLGAVNAAANTINKIFTPTLGWQTVNNIAAATPGVAVETDAELRARQTVSTALPALTVVSATQGAIANLTGVTDVKIYENDTATTNGDGIPRNSISAVVYGGVSADIAQTIALKKTPGTGTYGTTSVLTYDTRGMPITINFFRPTIKTIIAEVTIAAGVGWSSNYTDLIKQAVANSINALGIGDDVLLSKLYTPAYLVGNPAGATYTISTIKIAFFGNVLGTSNLAIAFNELAYSDYSVNVTVVVT